MVEKADKGTDEGNSRDKKTGQIERKITPNIALISKLSKYIKHPIELPGYGTFTVRDDDRITVRLAELQRLEENDMFDNDTATKIHKYINTFRTALGLFLNPEVAQDIKVAGYPDGAIVKIETLPNAMNRDQFVGNENSLQGALNTLSIDMHAYLSGENTEIFNEAVRRSQSPFKGTNIYGKDNIIIIKDANPENWTLEKAYQDVTDIIDIIKNSPQLIKK